MAKQKEYKVGEMFSGCELLEEKPSVFTKGGSKKRIGLFRCKCGKVFSSRIVNLITGNTVSCGCYRILNTSELNRSHGMQGTRIYNIWRNMNARCRRVTDKYYGGKGITVCKSWQKFENFYEDMKQGYKEELEIDRINNNLGYSKENCRRATELQQSCNQSSNIMYQGRCLADWCRILGYNYGTIRSRIRRGKTIEEALLHNNLLCEK